MGETPERHGGAVLNFLFRHWRPEGREARAGDRFRFRRREVALGRIYAGHRRQILLPTPNPSADLSFGTVPEADPLPIMRFFSETDDVPVVERDAYSFLRLLVARENDFSEKWTNQVKQELSVDSLLQHTLRHYLRVRGSEAERDDHSNLHLVELLLAYHHRAATGPEPAERLDPNALKRRFLTTELARSASETDQESVSHYAESLGWLLADSHVSWNAAEASQVLRWLRQLEETRFRDLAAAEGTHLTHLLRGLRLVRSNRDRLDAR